MCDFDAVVDAWLDIDAASRCGAAAGKLIIGMRQGGPGCSRALTVIGVAPVVGNVIIFETSIVGILEKPEARPRSLCSVCIFRHTSHCYNADSENE
jgi:hypothetical protein